MGISSLLQHPEEAPWWVYPPFYTERDTLVGNNLFFTPERDTLVGISSLNHPKETPWWVYSLPIPLLEAPWWVYSSLPSLEAPWWVYPSSWASLGEEQG